MDKIYEDYCNKIFERYENQILIGSQDDKYTLFKYFQYFASNYVTPFSDNKRILFFHGTGTGKTILSLLIAKKFIEKDIKVFIVTFNNTRFLEDMEYLNFSQEKRKLISIMGYKKFTNEVFNVNTNEFNYNFIKYVKNSLIICDESHNLYNTEDSNTYGKALQFINVYLRQKIFIVLLTATPINFYEEKYELLKILELSESKNIKNQKKQIKDWNRTNELKKSNEKDPANNPDNDIFKFVVSFIDGNLKKYDTIDKEISTIIGKISYMNILNEKFLPKVFHGGEKLGDIEPYKFIKCKYSDAHKKSFDGKNPYKFNYIYDLGFGQVNTSTDFNKEFLAEKKIEIKQKDGINYFSGGFVKDIGTYSTKYATLLNEIDSLSKKDVIKGKIVVYHHYVG